MKHVLLMSLMLIVSAGCSESEKSVGYYKEHPKEMEEKIAKCDKDTSKADANCARARVAKGESTVDKTLKSLNQK